MSVAQFQRLDEWTHLHTEWEMATARHHISESSRMDAAFALLHPRPGASMGEAHERRQISAQLIEHPQVDGFPALNYDSRKSAYDAAVAANGGQPPHGMRPPRPDPEAPQAGWFGRG